MQKNLTLTVGIPTWNRAHELRTALESVIAQWNDALAERVDILICDNASTDETPDVADSYAARYPGRIFCHRQLTNLGFSGNVDALFRHARGDFVLILSDDDALAPNALSYAFQAIDCHPDINALFLQPWAYDAELRNPRSPFPHRRSTGRDADCRYYATGSDFFRDRRTLFQVCISGVVFRRGAWLQIDLTPGLKSGSVQLHAAIQILARGSSCVLDWPLVQYRVPDEPARVALDARRDDGHNRGWPFVYFFDTITACRHGKFAYSPDIYRSFYRICVRGVIYTILEHKARGGCIDYAWFDRRIQECMDPDQDAWFSPFLRALARLPGCLLILPDAAYRVARRLLRACRKRS